LLIPFILHFLFPRDLCTYTSHIVFSLTYYSILPLTFLHSTIIQLEYEAIEKRKFLLKLGKMMENGEEEGEERGKCTQEWRKVVENGEVEGRKRLPRGEPWQCVG
jgi:hypothetical protein